MDLSKKIIEKGALEVEAILNEAKEEAQRRKDEIVDEVKEDANLKTTSIRADIRKEIRTKERLLNFEQRQASLLAKQNVIEQIFGEVKERLVKLKGKKLLDYIVNQLQKEVIIGNETMYVNKDEYKKYLEALSKNEASNLVDLDILNGLLKTNLKLSNKDISIRSGFILEGNDFNLNFDIDEVIEKLKDKHELEIVKKLFE